MHTVAVVVQVCELVTPLGDYAQRILEEGDDDQEATNGWQISVERPGQQHISRGARCHHNSGPGALFAAQKTLTA